MQIVDKRKKNTKKFEEINSGQHFMIGDKLFSKLNFSSNSPNAYSYNDVALAVLGLSTAVELIPRDAIEIHIKEIEDRG